MKTGEYASYAWQLKGITVSIPGWLDLTAGRLRFSTPEEIVFDVPLAEVTGVVYPWYYFGGGVKLRAAGTPYRISFVLPNGMEYASARGLASQGDPLSLLTVASKAEDIGAGRAVGQRWRELLGEGAPTAGETAPGASVG